MSYASQMLALSTQNFVSCAAGMAVLVALIRGFTQKNHDGIGNFWVDLTRTTLYVLLPLAIVLAIALSLSGVVQTFAGAHDFAVGPAASQVAIKQLGTDGGGFFNVNSAHPLENPTPLTNFVEVLAILIIPAALCFTFGDLIGGRRHGVVLYAAMMAIFIPLMVGCGHGRRAGQSAPRSPRRRRVERQHGGQRSPLWRCRVGHLGDRHNRSLERLGECDAR